jgi:acyl carrier protein
VTAATPAPFPGADIIPALRDILCEQLGEQPEVVVPEAHLRTGLRCDSLDEIEVVVAAEERFGIEVPDEALNRFAADLTVAQLAQLLAAHGARA